MPQRPAQGHNRFNNKNSSAGNNAPTSNVGGKGGAASQEDWENEEEWQGDLTKTQIFTASAQKKEITSEPK